MIEKVLYGTKIGDPDWAAQIITNDPDQFEPASAWAKANGFDRLQVIEIDLSQPPSFENTLNV